MADWFFILRLVSFAAVSTIGLHHAYKGRFSEAAFYMALAAAGRP